ncbi:MAG: enoyl-CoA hydratase/isomerase family protein [Pseudomonadota bacterium]|nr:enoyl-CoA hydratase/isomerase family protein [Pseudomonadota bacterium]
MNDTPTLLVDQKSEVLRLTLNRPEKSNALSIPLLDQIRKTLESFREKEIKCVVITGAGKKCFSAGGDLNELNKIRSKEETILMSECGHSALNAIRYFPVPVIAAINGVALGGGAELAMACDIRIAAVNADFGLIQSKLNVTTAWGGGIDLINTVGNSAALVMLCSGQRLTAMDAREHKIYEQVCLDKEDFMLFTDKFLKELCNAEITVLRAYKATAAKYRKNLQIALKETSQEGFVKSWLNPKHWEEAEKFLKKNK